MSSFSAIGQNYTTGGLDYGQPQAQKAAQQAAPQQAIAQQAVPEISSPQMVEGVTEELFQLRSDVSNYAKMMAQHGIDVTNPDVRDPDAMAAANLYNEKMNRLQVFAEQMKQGREMQKMHQQQVASGRVAGTSMPQGVFTPDAFTGGFNEVEENPDIKSFENLRSKLMTSSNLTVPNLRLLNEERKRVIQKLQSDALENEWSSEYLARMLRSVPQIPESIETETTESTTTQNTISTGFSEQQVRGGGGSGSGYGEKAQSVAERFSSIMSGKTPPTEHLTKGGKTYAVYNYGRTKFYVSEDKSDAYFLDRKGNKIQIDSSKDGERITHNLFDFINAYASINLSADEAKKLRQAAQEVFPGQDDYFAVENLFDANSVVPDDTSTSEQIKEAGKFTELQRMAREGIERSETYPDLDPSKPIKIEGPRIVFQIKGKKYILDGVEIQKREGSLGNAWNARSIFGYNVPYIIKPLSGGKIRVIDGKKDEVKNEIEISHEDFANLQAAISTQESQRTQSGGEKKPQGNQSQKPSPSSDPVEEARIDLELLTK